MRVSVRQTVLAAVFAILLAFGGRAEQFSEKFLQTKWTTENGLPQNSVTSIAQTQDGYLWLGTFGGLARFDGVRFKIYTTGNTPELKSNRITALKTDAADALWIGTESGEIIVFDGFKFSLVEDGRKVKTATIGDIFADETGVVWAASSVGLLRCTVAGCAETDFRQPAARIRKDNNGDFWILSNFRLYKADKGNFAESRLIFEDVRNIELAPKGGIWLVFADKFGVLRNGNYKTLGTFPLAIVNSDFSIAPDGSCWLSVSNFLYKIREEAIGEFQDLNLPKENSKAVFVDRENNVWLGRIGDGLFRLLPRRVNTLTAEKGFPEKTSANSIVEDREGNVWIATNQGLIRRRDGKTEIFAAESYGLDNITRGALLVDRDGVLWNNTSAGLQNFSDGKLILRKDLPLEKTESGNALFQDSRGNLWAGCSGCGIYKIADGKITERFTAQNGLVGDKAVVFAETRDGAIWIGTTSGVSRLKDGAFTNFTSRGGLSNEYVRDIADDADGAVWFGTYGGGLNRYKDGKFTPITTGDGLFDDFVSRILVDDDDNFWMLGNRGIFSVSRKMLNDFADGRIRQIFCTAFTTADGMLTSEGNGGYQNAGTRTRDGRLWFPMINGVVIIDPKQEKLPPPKPLIEEVFLNGKAVDIAKKVEINPGNESLEINYTGLSFRKPEQIRFRYRLAGLDENWTEAGTRRLANYPYLPSGNYRFQLSAANADGVWNELPAEFEIKVYPPFYRTLWFFILLQLIFFAAIYCAYRYRNWRFAHDKAVREEFARRLLNAQETERRKIASDIHDNLGQQLLVIKNWAAYCLSKTSKTSKIREQIVQISETADEALNEVRSMAKTLSPYHLDKAGLTNTIRFMVKQVAESCEIDFRTEIDAVCGILSKEGEINLYRIAQEAVNNIVKHSNATRAEVILKREENRLKLTVKDNGRGFYEADSDYQKFGTGLNGMTERARMLNGNLSVKSIPKRGTQINLEIPVNE